MINDHNPSNGVFTFVLSEDNCFDPRQMTRVRDTGPWIRQYLLKVFR